MYRTLRLSCCSNNFQTSQNFLCRLSYLENLVIDQPHNKNSGYESSHSAAQKIDCPKHTTFFPLKRDLNTDLCHVAASASFNIAHPRGFVKVTMPADNRQTT